MGTNFNTAMRYEDRTPVMAAGAKQEEVLPIKLVIDSIPFEGTLAGKLITTTKLASAITQTFRTVFCDVSGSIINVDYQTGAIVGTVFFEDNGTVGTDSLKRAITKIVDDTKPTNAYERMMLVSAKRDAYQYKLTPEGMGVLDPFIPMNKRNNKGKVNWNDRINGPIKEITDRPANYYYTKPTIYIAVDIDLVPLLKKLYGDVNSRGHKVDYAVNFVRSYGLTGTDAVLCINQLDNNDLRAIANEIGARDSSSGSLYMIKE